jgi:hypothetical protein
MRKRTNTPTTMPADFPPNGLLNDVELAVDIGEDSVEVELRTLAADITDATLEEDAAWASKR